VCFDQGRLRRSLRMAEGTLARSKPSSMLPLPFPREVVRDLLGITRAPYRAEQARETPDLSRLARLEKSGADSGRHDMGARFAPDTLGRRSGAVLPSEPRSSSGSWWRRGGARGAARRGCRGEVASAGIGLSTLGKRERL
jgi:hypothetical protein